MPSFVQSKSATGNSTAPSYTWTTTPTAGDLLVCGVLASTATPATMSSAGWTALTSNTINIVCRMFWKIAGAGESGTVTATTGSGLWAICGAQYDYGRQIPAMSREGVTNSGGSTNCNTPTRTPPSGSEVLVVCFSGMTLATPTFCPAPLELGPPTIGGLASNKRENTASASAMNATLYDLIDPNGDGTYSGSCSTQAGTSSVAAGAIATFVRTPHDWQNAHSPRGADGISVTEAGGFG